MYVVAPRLTNMVEFNLHSDFIITKDNTVENVYKNIAIHGIKGI